MASEIDWQAKIVKRLKREGAYARKASSTYAVGVLDLDVISHLTGAVKIEVKLEHTLKPGWRRQLDYTEKQKEEASRVISCGGQSLGLLVAHYTPTNVWLYFHEMPPPRVRTQVTEDQVFKDGVQWKSSGHGCYLIEAIMDGLERMKNEEK